LNAANISTDNLTSKEISAETCTITGTEESTSTTTGAMTVAGGVGVEGNIYANAVYGSVWNDYAEYRK
jgi:hypothetical protein